MLDEKRPATSAIRKQSSRDKMVRRGQARRRLRHTCWGGFWGAPRRGRQGAERQDTARRSGCHPWPGRWLRRWGLVCRLQKCDCQTVSAQWPGARGSGGEPTHGRACLLMAPGSRADEASLFGKQSASKEEARTRPSTGHEAGMHVSAACSDA